MLPTLKYLGIIALYHSCKISCLWNYKEDRGIQKLPWACWISPAALSPKTVAYHPSGHQTEIIEWPMQRQWKEKQKISWRKIQEVVSNFQYLERTEPPCICIYPTQYHFKYFSRTDANLCPWSSLTCTVAVEYPISHFLQN